MRPNLFLVGAAKSGTTTLHSLLAHHPSVFMSTPKELHFFSYDIPLTWRAATDLDTYLSYFASEVAIGSAWIGESSPSYLPSRVAAEGIYELNPQARILIALRNPADLIAALHSQLLTSGVETTQNLVEALRLESKRAESDQWPIWIRYRYVASLAPQVRRYLDAFPRTQIHIMNFDDLSTSPDQLLATLMDFLGLSTDPAQRHAIPHLNPHKSVRSVGFQRLLQRPDSTFKRLLRPATSAQLRSRWVKRLAALNQHERPRVAMPRELREELTTAYLSEIDELATLTGLDLSAWKGTP